MIYDCFSFYNELDLLEIRLNVLWDVVDKFVFTEGTKTHTGKPRELVFLVNRDRFSNYESKIVYIPVDDFPERPKNYTDRDVTWMNEDWQRNAVKRVLREVANPDDLVMISDVDEIPSPEAVRIAAGRNGVVAFEQLLSNYYLNFVSYTSMWWRGTKAAKYRVFADKTTYAKMKPSPYVDEVTNRGATASRLRHVKPDSIIKKAGWHFSYLGGAKAIVDKIGSIAQEYSNENNTNEEWVAKVITQGLDINHSGRRFFCIPLDERFPAYLRVSQDKYSDMILCPEADYFRHTRWARVLCLVRGWVRKNGARLIPGLWKDWLYKNIYSRIVKEPIVM